MNEQNHDWDRQYGLTKEVWETLKERGVNFNKKHKLDLQFMPQSDSADKAGFAAALRDAGFQVHFYEGDPTVEATMPDVMLTLETIWRLEKKGTEIAFRFGYGPDGWGFMHDPEATE